MANYVLSPETATSIAEINSYKVQQFRSKQARRYLENLLNPLEFIAEDPQRGMHRPEIKAGLFSYFVGSHRIYYRFSSEQIQVIDILHQSMEPTHHLSK